MSKNIFIENYNNQIYAKTKKYQKIYGFKIGTGVHDTWNNEADAFKHTFMQADLALRTTTGISKIAGDYHENSVHNNPQREENMDKWNNQQGRRIADQIKKEYGKNFYKFPKSKQDDIIAEKVMQKMRKGELITNPSDKRKYTGFAADIDNAQLKTYFDEKGNKAAYLDDGDDISKEFLEKLDTKDRLIHNKEFNLTQVKDKIYQRRVG